VDSAIALLVANEGPARVRELLTLGVPFDVDDSGAFLLALEAAHGRTRVARVKGDLAGRAIMETLNAALCRATHVECVEGVSLHSLLQDATGRVVGVACEVSNPVNGDVHGEAPGEAPGELRHYYGAATVLATGGLGGLYAVTTNPDTAQGVALAAGWRAGARLRDLEFVQFHPTALDVQQHPAPLVTEALRGHGAVLVNTSGEPFMKRYHSAGDLAPRDVVARAIHAERVAGRGTALDARRAVGAKFPEEFPTVFAACQAAGIDPRVQPIPVAPAAHYHMGGLATDAQARTTLPGLYAVGECASTGLHGANRLASNSLLEALVFAHRAAEQLRADWPLLDGEGEAVNVLPELASGQLPEFSAGHLPEPALQLLRERMSRDAGLVRNAEGLQGLLSFIDGLRATHGDANPLLAARLVASAALQRQESRGGHYRSDYPEPNPKGTPRVA
jgi:L-aspartate oxidase